MPHIRSREREDAAWKLFNLADDPAEQQDLADARPRVFSRCKGSGIDTCARAA